MNLSIKKESRVRKIIKHKSFIKNKKNRGRVLYASVKCEGHMITKKKERRCERRLQ